jgi:hypothetical protein
MPPAQPVAPAATQFPKTVRPDDDTVADVALDPLRTTTRLPAHAVAFRRRTDGVLTATCLGVTGAGPSEAEAVGDLERRLGVSSPPAEVPAGRYAAAARALGQVLAEDDETAWLKPPAGEAVVALFGVTGVGRNTAEAIRDLAAKLRAAGRGVPK